MKLVAWLVLLWALLASNAQSAGAKLERITLYGVAYVRLDDWAATFKFKQTWLSRGHTVRLTSRWSALEFSVNSRKVIINGVAVWLGAPVALHRGSAWIAAADLANTLHPILFPTRLSADKKIKSICLDPGHGGRDPGNHDGRQNEKVYTLSLAKELSRRLSQAGFKVFFTRESDSWLALPDRAPIANARRADLFLSLHFNAAAGPGSSAVNGIETYCMTPARASSTNAGGEGGDTGAFPGNRLDSHNLLLAFQLQRSMTARLGAEDRGVRRARFMVLRDARMPAALIEGGFLTNPRDAKRIHDPAYHRQLAQAITEGVLAYKKAAEASYGKKS